MKFKKIFQKAAAVVMAAVTVFSVLPATTAFAAVGDVGTISFSHTYDGNGNAMRYNSSANINGYIAGGTGNYKYRMFVDGDTAFCLQPGVPLKTGNTLKEASSEAWNALSRSQKKAVGLALLYGYQGNRGNLSGSDDEKWLATQTLVWEFVTGCREATGSYRQTSSTVYSLHFGSHYPNSGAKKVYDQIVSLMSKHNTIPSFMSGGKDDITKELVYKDGKYSLTLTDKNGVLSEYSFASSSDAVSVAKSGNKLTLTSKKAFHGSVRITATRNGVPVVSQSAKLIAYGDPNLQDVITGVENASPVSAYLNVETPTGTIALKKTSEDGVVAGIQFTIKGEGINKTVTTDENGNITVEGLFPATYTITEQTIDRYEPQQTQTVTLIGGKTTTVNFNNTLKRGSLEVVKTSEDNLVEGVKFHLYGTSLSGLAVDEYAVTDGKGVAKFEDVLISGDTPYVLEEVDTAIRYVVPASQTAPIEWNKVTNRSFQNILKKFNVTVTKTDAETGTPQGDASLAGAVYGIYKGEELIDTYTTDENGQFTTKYYVCGDDWTIREISPSEGYLLDPTIHKVGAEPELYEVEYNSVENDVNEQVIKGNIAIIKHTDDGETGIETPEEGAVFEVFLKSAGSFEQAKESERDKLVCDENGFAQTKDMPYLMRGTPYIYQGEEIGMTNPHYTSIEQYADVESRNYYEILLNEGKTKEEALEILAARSRDNSRTPMQWTDERYCGFSDTKPWIPVSDNFEKINVKKQKQDRDSILEFYKKLIMLRKEKEVIARGNIEFMEVENAGVLAYTRCLDKQKLLVCCNFRDVESQMEFTQEWKSGRKILGNYEENHKNNYKVLTLRPYEIIVLEKGEE